MTNVARRLISPFLIPIVYLALGLTWIITSDTLLSVMISDPEVLSSVQTMKGWGYVSLTATLLYFYVAGQFQRRLAMRQKIQQTSENFRRLLESGCDGRWITGADGVVVQTNQRLQRLLGATHDQLVRDGIESRFEAGDWTTLTPDGANVPADPAVDACDAPSFRTGESSSREEVRAVSFKRGIAFRESESTAASSADPAGPVAVAPAPPASASAPHAAAAPPDDSSRGWGLLSSVPILGADGGVDGRLHILSDLTRLHRAELSIQRSYERERRLRDELNHRVRNNLMALLSLIDLSRSGARSVGAFAEQISSRVRAIASVHSFLAESRFADIDLRRLAESIDEKWHDRRIHFKGEPIPLVAMQAPPLAMILDELRMNSVKHGVLRAGAAHGPPAAQDNHVLQPVGAASPTSPRVDVRWWVQHAADFGERGTRLVCVEWIESRGSLLSAHPAAFSVSATVGMAEGDPNSDPKSDAGVNTNPDSRTGMGLTIMQGLAASDLQGDFVIEFLPGGARALIRFPLAPEPARNPGDAVLA